MLVDDAPRNPESETRSVDAFGRVESLEDLSRHLGGHTASVICNADTHTWNPDTWNPSPPAPGIACLDNQATAGPHRFYGVPDQVVQHLPYLTLVAGNALGTEMAHGKFNVGICESSREETECWGEQLLRGKGTRIR